MNESRGGAIKIKTSQHQQKKKNSNWRKKLNKIKIHPRIQKRVSLV